LDESKAASRGDSYAKADLGAIKFDLNF